MSEETILQLKKLATERKVKRDSKSRDVKDLTVNVNTERSKKTERGDKIVEKILKCL